MAQHSPKEFMRVIQMVDPDSHAIAVDIEDVDTNIDTIGFRYLILIVNIGDMNSGTWTLQLEASDAVAGTYADVTGAVFTLVGTEDDTRLVGVVDLFATDTNIDRYVEFKSGAVATGAIDLGVTAILWAPESDDYVDFSSGGNDELTFEV